MGTDVATEVAKLQQEGKHLHEIQRVLETRGFSGADVAAVLSHVGNKEERRNSRLLATREIIDRIGYGSATPQFVNILFWLSAQTYPHALFFIGTLNGIKILLGICLSNLLQEYSKLHRFTKNTISAAGISFGFSFLLLAFALLIQNKWFFAVGFLISSVGFVTYGDLYRHFIRDTIKKEKMGPFLRSIAHWGVLITAASLLVSGYLLHFYPMSGTKITLFGRTMTVYGYLLAFEITALALIISGYITSFIADHRDERSYAFFRFLREHHYMMKSRISVFLSNKYVALLTLATLLGGLFQVVIASYSGIAIYTMLDARVSTPFIWLACIYAIAVIASFTGPFFTEQIHRSTGLTPTLVFGTLLMAIFPFALVYKTSILAIAIALVFHVIGNSITGFGQGLLAKKLLHDDIRDTYFRTQSMLLALPYILLIPAIALFANTSLTTTFLFTGIGMVALLMPIYFILVLLSQHEKL